MVSRERLAQLLAYEPVTGLFKWRVNRGRARAGYVAGCLASHGYWFIRVDGRLYTGHRLAWLYVHGSFPHDELDHVNGVRSDNRLANLRPASSRQNKGNTKLRSDNTSGYKGVVRSLSGWEAQIEVDGRCKRLGIFSEPQLAHAAYQQAAVSYFGEFARTS